MTRRYMSEEAQYARHNEMRQYGERDYEPSGGEIAYYEMVAREQRQADARAGHDAFTYIPGVDDPADDLEDES